MMIMFSFYQKKIIQSIESAKLLLWRKVIVLLQRNWKIAITRLVPHITRRMCKRLLNTYRGWSIPALIIKCSLPQT